MYYYCVWIYRTKKGWYQKYRGLNINDIVFYTFTLLVINIQVKQKQGFVRTGQDVVYYMTISFPQAVLGAVINVPTAYGTVNCEIPVGIKLGEQLCLAGYSFENKKKVGTLCVLTFLNVFI